MLCRTLTLFFAFVSLSSLSAPAQQRPQGNRPPGAPAATPAAVADCPYELIRTTEAIVRKEFPNLVQYSEIERGGHFGAFEEPNLITNDIKKFVKTVVANEQYI